mgnify:FL=1
MEKFIKRVAIAILTGILAFAVIPATVQAAGWKQNKNGYWWQENDYSYPRNQWKIIYGKQYHFNSSGYMDTGWKKIDGKWYYLGSKNDGAKKTYWQKVYGKYYWLGNDGAMRTGWQKVYNKYYWLGSSNDGAMKIGWQKVYGKYYWLGHSNDGAMKTGWQTVYGKKYYLGGANDGAMKTGWQKIDGYDYYFGKTGESNEGVLRTNTWVGNYYVDANGRWDKSKTVVDIKNYLTNYKNLVSKLGMKKTTSWQFGSSDSYVKDGFYLEWQEGYSFEPFSMKNESADYIRLNGISIGDSENSSDVMLRNAGWENKFEWNGENGYTKKINGTLHALTIYINSSGCVKGWYLNNWPQGADWFSAEEDETPIVTQNEKKQEIIEENKDSEINKDQDEQKEETNLEERITETDKIQEEKSQLNENDSKETQECETQSDNSENKSPKEEKVIN